MNHVSVIILTAGLSSRMKTDKAFLPFDEKQNFLQKTVIEYDDFGADEIVVVANKFMAEKIKEMFVHKPLVKTIINALTVENRFYSVRLGMKNTSAAFCFIQNIDNPFVDKNLLEFLFRYKNPEGYTVPVFQNRGGHPVLVSEQVMHFIRNEKKTDANLHEVLRLFSRKEVSVTQPSVLFNINTPEDYRSLFGSK